MRTVIGITLGLLGGLLLNIDIGAIIALGGPWPSDDTPLSWLVVAWGLALCALCSVILLRRTTTIRQVVERGAIMGLILWGALIPLGPIMVRKYAVSPGSGLSADPVIAAEDLGVLTWLTLGMVILMVLVSAAVLWVARAREPQPQHRRGELLSQ